MSAGRLDLVSDPNIMPVVSAQGLEQTPGITAEGKKFLGIKFSCCGLYARIYVNRDGTAYEGRCPRCLQPIKIKIGQGGTSTRFFETN